MKRWLALALVVGLALGGASACRRADDELTPSAAAEALSTNVGFTTREKSLVGRRLEAVLAVRRIGLSSTEVEFTWRDYPLPPGQTGPVKTSAALFRKDDEGRWALAAFFKVD
jgi:hypothetical protein